MMLTDRQSRFFDTFGFLHLPGLIGDSIDWIVAEFEEIFARRIEDGELAGHDGTRRTSVVPFIDQSEKLCTLLDHPVIHGLAASLLGEDFNYLAGDGHFYVGDTPWHSDGWNPEVRYIKIAFYLDALAGNSGCLRVIPGSHCIDDTYAKLLQECAGKNEAVLGIESCDLPAVSVETQPGDLVVFNHNLKHASFGGGTRRRMFTMNLCEHCETESELESLQDRIGRHARYLNDRMHSDAMRDTGPPERVRHLQQVIENEGHLPELVRRERKKRDQPVRG
jgi:hypothetical protein